MAALGQTVEIDFQDHPIEVDLNMGKTLEEETLGEETSEEDDISVTRKF